MNRFNPAVLRTVDANANRAREALRVLEDYARFSLNDSTLSGELKRLRHELRAALTPLLNDAILFRDTPADVGTIIKTAAELKRESVAQVVIAAGKRLGEALRTLEEFSKIDSPAAAAQIEALRYRFYSLEQAIHRTLRTNDRLAEVRLYVLITESSCAGRNWLQTARAAIEGGAQCLQLREKSLDGGELLKRARQFTALCREMSVVSIINDRIDIALASNADGVHVGQEDLPATEARSIMGREKLIGVSTHRLEQAQQAVRDGADYIGVGPVFPSGTKPRNFLPGMEYAQQIAAAELPIPAFAIAGITLENVDQLLSRGMNRVAVTAACVSAPDPRSAAAQFCSKLASKALAPAKSAPLHPGNR